MTETKHYFVGLDLGQQSDFTALTVLERTDQRISTLPKTEDGAMGVVHITPAGPIGVQPPPKKVRSYQLRHIQRFDLGTAYDRIVDAVVAMFGKPPLAGGNLAIDATGVGRAVVDMFVRARPKASIRPITITGSQGNKVTPDGPGWKVPKKDLVGVLQVLLQNKKLKIGRTLPHAQTLVSELENFRAKITVHANETFEAWRESAHDDLVLSLAIAAWVSEKGLKELWVR